jgi:hypothetical protein
MFMFTFDSYKTTYAGTRAGQSITGIFTTFEGVNGCFYMLKQGVPTTFAIARAPGKRDLAGQS